MRIATWNINECAGITCDLDNQEIADKINMKNVSEIIDKINEYDFDIICFQEYPTYVSDTFSLTKGILDNTKLKYYAEKDTYDSFLFKGGRIGVSIFSKYEIIDSFFTIFVNPHMVKKSSHGETYYSFDKAIIKVVLNVDNTKYTVITGHAMAFAPFGKTEYDYPESYKPLEELIQSSSNDNLIVLGDFNTENLQSIIPGINGIVHDIVDVTTTKDFYEKRRELHMDYIMLKDDIKCISKYKIDNYSDHYIIGADIKLTR